MTDVVIASAVRTAIGRFGGALKDTRAPELGAAVLRAAVERAGITPAEINEVIMGNVVSAGLGQNPARQAALFAGIPKEAGACTLNKVCASGLRAVIAAAQVIKAGDADIVAAGGMENMSWAPYLLPHARFGYRMGRGEIVDAMVNDGLWDIYNNFHMGITGEIVAERFGITREDADAMALSSHQKALRALREGWFREEIVPVEVVQKKGKMNFDRDEGPREDCSAEGLARLKPAFKEDGIVTAGNASQISDGASAVLVMSHDIAEEKGIAPMARIVGYAVAGVAPEHVMEAPIPATRKALERCSMSVNDIDLFEHNEAFASASCAVAKELGLPLERFNVHGGAVALGHPIGASGARVLTTLLYALKRHDAKRGLATICLGGGNAVTMIVER